MERDIIGMQLGQWGGCHPGGTHIGAVLRGRGPRRSPGESRGVRRKEQQKETEPDLLLALPKGAGGLSVTWQNRGS